MATIESKVVDAILQRTTKEIEIDGVIYRVAQPTAATLMLASEAAAGVPTTAFQADFEKMVTEVLRTAKDYRVIGTIAAILILGAERVNEKILVELKRVTLKRRFSWRKMRVVPVRIVKRDVVEEKDALAERILFNCRSSVLRDIVSTRFHDNEVADFFGITTSLSEINILKPTREVVETTTFGQS